MRLTTLCKPAPAFAFHLVYAKLKNGRAHLYHFFVTGRRSKLWKASTPFVPNSGYSPSPSNRQYALALRPLGGSKEFRLILFPQGKPRRVRSQTIITERQGLHHENIQIVRCIHSRLLRAFTEGGGGRPAA